MFPRLLSYEVLRTIDAQLGPPVRDIFLDHGYYSSLYDKQRAYIYHTSHVNDIFPDRTIFCSIASSLHVGPF